MSEEKKPKRKGSDEMRMLAEKLLEQAKKLEELDASTRPVATMIEEAGRTLVAAAKEMRKEAREG